MEVLPQQKLFVLVIVIRLYSYQLRLCPALHRNAFTLRLLLRQHRRHPKLTKLQLCLQPEQRLHPTDQAALQREADVAGFYLFQHLIFLTAIVQFLHVLVVKCRLGIIADVEFQFVPHSCQQVDIHLHVKVKYPVLLRTLHQCRIFDILPVTAKGHVHITLRFHLYGIASEDAVEKAVLIHLRQFRCLVEEHQPVQPALPVVIHILLTTVFFIFIQCQVGRIAQKAAA